MVPGRSGHVWKPLLRLPVCRIKKEINGQAANVSCFFGLQSFKESLAEQAVWHRQKRFRKKFSQAQPTYSAQLNFPPQMWLRSKREINGLFQQYEIYCQEYLLQQTLNKNHRLNTQIYLAFSAECGRPTSRFSDRTPKQCSQNV